VRDIRGGTSAGRLRGASTLLAGHCAVLCLHVAALEARIPVRGVNGAALFDRSLAAHVAEEIRRWQVVRGKRAPHVGRSAAPAKLRWPAALHVVAQQIAWLKRMRWEIEGGLGDRHEGDDAEDQSNFHSGRTIAFSGA